ncbi:hypothetical protein GCM10010326_66050 [Streptomyces xanthochromogenes]|uniref:Transposase Helix-turn-helix domain-containing protein n=1 Tax=Streptomyces xanthochromogenes TaxID=67384 RepID=A0ABQ3API7_9ACTN|nr:hypothetical protein GCM10010326_66050 [Streptomyces xanthochromogenes]
MRRWRYEAGRGLTLENRVRLVTSYWRTHLTMRQLAPLFGISKSAADRIIGHVGPLLALQPRRRFAQDTVLIADGTLVPTRDHQVAEQSKNYRYSTNHQVVIDADTRRVVAVGRMEAVHHWTDSLRIDNLRLDHLVEETRHVGVRARHRDQRHPRGDLAALGRR